MPRGDAGHPGRRAGRHFKSKMCLEFFSLKNHLSFGLRFIALRKCSKLGSLDMSQNQSAISSRFSSQNSSHNFSIAFPPRSSATCPSPSGPPQRAARCVSAAPRSHSTPPRKAERTGVGTVTTPCVPTVEERDLCIRDGIQSYLFQAQHHLTYSAKN